MFTKVSVTALLAGAAAAYHAPGQGPLGNAITAPLIEVVPACKPYTIKWTPSTPNKVSLLLLKGPSSNVVFNQVIVEGIDNSGSFTWTPPAGLEATAGPGGYGIQLIDDVNGQFQYSTQFGINNDACKPVASSSSSAAPTPTATITASSKGGYEVATPTPSSSSIKVYETPSASVNSSSTYCSTTTLYVPPPPAATGSVNSTVIYPTIPMSVPETLKTTGTAAPTGTPAPSAPVQFPGSASGVKAGLGLAGAVAGFVLML